MSEWISVEERLPEQFEYVVAARMYGHGIDPDMYVSFFVSDRFTVCDDALEASNYDGGACITSKIEPTHWMPLPEPPKD